MENKQTAVDWLFDQINKRGPKENNPPQWLKELYNQAKAIEKNKMLEFWKGGQDSMEEGGKSFEQYYNETFKQQDND